MASLQRGGGGRGVYIFSSGGKSLITLVREGRRDVKTLKQTYLRALDIKLRKRLVIRGLDTIVLALCSTGFILVIIIAVPEPASWERLISGAKRLSGSLLFLVSAPLSFSLFLPFYLSFSLFLPFLYFSSCENSGIKARLFNWITPVGASLIAVQQADRTKDTLFE